MPLKINLRHLEEHEVRLQGELPAGELDFDLHDELIRAEKPLRYDLTAEKLHDAVLVQGRLELTLDCQCVRCLKSFQTENRFGALGGAFAAGRRGQGGH